MPIRIEKDNDTSGYSPRPQRGGGGGGGGIGGNLIPVLIGLFGRNPKLLLIVAVLAGGYFLLKGGCGNGNISNAMPFATGASFDPKKYAATEIYEPLADNKRNPLPEQVSLIKFAPKRGDQGQQGSCVAWAAAYSARSIMEARETGANPNQVRYSPSFLYNQIALEGCQGSYLPEALKVMEKEGLVAYEAFPYTDQDCNRKPGSADFQKAADHKINGYQRLTGGRDGTDAKSVNMLAIKQNIAQGAPVLIGMMVGGSFMQNMVGQEKWLPTEEDYQMTGFGGHAMTVIGYDDFKFSPSMGGFQIMNSWGEAWGKEGICWVAYQDFEFFTKEAYGLYPLGEAGKVQTRTISGDAGIVLNNGNTSVPLRQIDEFTFQTLAALRKGEKAGDRFKLQVTNSNECYVYVFGKETDNSAYSLFPYTPKHSPYCGIKGTRMFPRDHSMYPDDAGNLDEFAIVISEKPLDYEQFAKRLTTATGSSFSNRLAQLTAQTASASVSANGIGFSADFSAGDVIGFVVQVQK
jgi:hypothetical protein